MDYTSLLASLRDAACLVDPAGCDGLVCGMLCAHAGHDADACANEVEAYFGLEQALSGGARAALADLRAHAVGALDADGFEFNPLLPDDDVPLDARASAFRTWCASFLHGLGTGGMRDGQALGEQAREALVDIAEFTRMEPPGVEPGDAEEDEQALFELTEYLRVAVVLLREELRASNPGPADTIH